MRIKTSILCTLFICILQPLVAFAKDSLQSIEAKATRQAIKGESVITKRMYLERIAAEYLPQILWVHYTLRPHIFAPSMREKPFFEATIPSDARRIDPNASPTPLPKQKKRAKAKPKSPITLPVIPSIPTVKKAPEPTIVTLPKTIVPTTPPLPVPGPRNPLDGDVSALATPPKDPAWEWPEEQ